MTRARARRKASDQLGSPRRKGTENQDKEVQCLYCGKSHRKRECRKRICDQGSGQEALAEDETPPGCEEEAEHSWILMLGLDSLHGDGNVEGGRLFIDGGAALSACPPQLCAGTSTRLILGATLFRAANGATIKRYREKTIRRQCQGTSIDVNFQVADVHRSVVAVRVLTAIGCDVEFCKSGACFLTVGRHWKLEQGCGQFFLTFDSLRDVSKNLAVR